MNNRYLYRAKRIDNGEWVEGYYTYYPHGFTSEDKMEHTIRDTVTSEDCNKLYFIDPNTICQCTGLKDKNGKLIWENDIIRYADMIIGTEKIDRIEWNETHASFVRLHTSQMGLQYLYIDEFIANGCEVIGNIFENPELIKLD